MCVNIYTHTNTPEVFNGTQYQKPIMCFIVTIITQLKKVADKCSKKWNESW